MRVYESAHATLKLETRYHRFLQKQLVLHLIIYIRIDCVIETPHRDVHGEFGKSVDNVKNDYLLDLLALQQDGKGAISAPSNWDYRHSLAGCTDRS